MNVATKIIESTADQDELWFKDAIIYQLHVKAFADSNGDGMGDFQGLTERLDYLKDLGVNTLWLLPFYPSPGRDDGYDISDYGDINKDFGTMRDFRRFMNEAKSRNLRVVIELVVNHTSDQHPWFRRAKRSAPGSSARNWYVWSDTDHKYAGTRIIFTDTEKSNWTWDSEANSFYWHRFFAHQPDLNFDNPRVVKAILQVMKRWLDTGVDGFRLDAVPYLIERDGTSNENLPETHTIIKTLRSEIDAYGPGKVLLAEANMWPEDVQQYFGNGDECHMAYHFPLMPRIYMAIAQEDRFPVTDIIRQTPEIPENCQWAMFLRNHDELTLEMVTDAERDYLWSTYAADPRARINLGIRRRLAPLMDNDRRKIELMNAILMSMPGTPIIYYGDEIGMGDNIYLGDRNSVRTPMQWTPDRNGGFSKADPARLYLPCNMDAIYGYQSVNVEAQTRSQSSLLSWTKRLIGVRKSTKVFGRGTLTIVRPKNRAVLAYVRQLDNEAILCVANLSRSAQAVELDLSAWKGRVPQEMLGRTLFPRIGELPYLVTLPPYGFYWFQMHEEEGDWQDVMLPRDVTTLVFGDTLASLYRSRNLSALETDVLPPFLLDRRWFGEKSAGRLTVKMGISHLLQSNGQEFALTLADVASERGHSRYFLPMYVHWVRYTELDQGPGKVLAAVRRAAREGALVDAALEPDFISALVGKMCAGEILKSAEYELVFKPTVAFTKLSEFSAVKPVGVEQSNTSMIAGDRYVVKIFRKIKEGIHPEIEMGRFLSESAPFPNSPSLLGALELREGETCSAMAVVHEFIENQGDAWSIIGQSLDRLIDDHRMLSDEMLEGSPEHVAMLTRIKQVGVRTAHCHLKLASRPDILDFAPEPISEHDMALWHATLAANAEAVFTLLSQSHLTAGAARAADELLLHREDIIRHIKKYQAGSLELMKIRQHGDLHLGQILIAKDDAYILDFEGEPRRSLEERRRKFPVMRDVAGLCRSIDYAVAAALRRLPDMVEEERTGLEKSTQAWVDELTTTFLDSYRETLNEGSLWPEGEDKASQLLAFFLLEKAFYEIEYEISNRPEWASIPLEATVRILKNLGVLGQ